MKFSMVKYKWMRYLIVMFLCGGVLFAQENNADAYRMGFTFKTVKNHDNSRLLEVSFIGKNKKDRKDKIPIYEAEVLFYNLIDEEEVLLGTSKTNQDGIAAIVLTEDHDYLLDEEGFINFKAVFEGSEGIDEQSEELRVKDLILELYLEEVDSVKTATVRAFTMDSLGTKTPVEEADIYIGVEGMLSKMNLEEGYIDAGQFEYEFPTDLPGDMNGNLIVFAMMEDHEEYGNVIQKQEINWGVFNRQEVKKVNTLWSEAAPIWMYVVLTILLVGVWVNYGYSIYNLFMIRKEGRDLVIETTKEKEA